LKQTANLLQDLGRSPKQVIVDLGYRGVDADNPGVQIIHRGKFKSLSDHEKRLLKRRQAIEPLIGHTRADHRMDRCWLQGAVGDALHALCCAAGYNIRWLLRAITRLGLGALFCALSAVAVCVASLMGRCWRHQRQYELLSGTLHCARRQSRHCGSPPGFEFRRADYPGLNWLPVIQV